MILKWITVAVCLSAAAAVSATAQDTIADQRTMAAPYATRGAIGGGVVMGVLFGVLSMGLCDAADCSGAFSEGVVPGVLVGGALGGITGFVAGSFVARSEPQPMFAGSFSPGIGGGVTVGATEWQVGWNAEITALKPVTRQVRAGFAIGYTSAGDEVDTRFDNDPVYGPVHGVERTARRFGYILMMSRTGNRDDRNGLFLEVRSGWVYKLDSFAMAERDPSGNPVRAGQLSHSQHGHAIGLAAGAGFRIAVAGRPAVVAADLTTVLPSESLLTNWHVRLSIPGY